MEEDLHQRRTAVAQQSPLRSTMLAHLPHWYQRRTQHRRLCHGSRQGWGQGTGAKGSMQRPPPSLDFMALAMPSAGLEGQTTATEWPYCPFAGQLQS